MPFVKLPTWKIFLGYLSLKKNFRKSPSDVYNCTIGEMSLEISQLGSYNLKNCTFWKLPLNIFKRNYSLGKFPMFNGTKGEIVDLENAFGIFSLFKNVPK